MNLLVILSFRGLHPEEQKPSTISCVLGLIDLQAGSKGKHVSGKRHLNIYNKNQLKIRKSYFRHFTLKKVWEVGMVIVLTGWFEKTFHPYNLF